MNSIVDASAYLLFYRRRSEEPLGGPRFREILERFQDDSSDTELSGSGEGQRLGEVSSLAGSSSAFQGAGATHPAASHGGSNVNQGSSLDRTADDSANAKANDDIPLLVGSRYDGAQEVQQSIEEDEGIDMGDNTTNFAGLQQVTTATWSFRPIEGPENFTAGTGSANTSEIASDVAQHDSSGDERALSQNLEYEQDVPGTSSYSMGPQTEFAPPSDKESQMASTVQDMDVQWDQNQVYQVPPTQANERRSEETAEIHLDDESDKIKIG